MGMLTLVVARYREDVSWVTHVDANVFIVDKSQIGNTGREASSWLWFIAQHYQSLEGDYLFCQGDPFAHCPDFIAEANRADDPTRMLAPIQQRHFGERLTCDWNGAPHQPGLKIEETLPAINQQLERAWNVPALIEFTAGGQFLASAEEIRYGLTNYGAWRLKAMADTWPDAPWVFERLWDYLIP
jgi:Protein of unknown function (DUF3431)